MTVSDKQAIERMINEYSIGEIIEHIKQVAFKEEPINEYEHLYWQRCNMTLQDALHDIRSHSIDLLKSAQNA